MITKEKIMQLSDEIYDEIISIRRHIHQYPELAFNEYKTADYIIEQLKKLNISIIKRFANTGICAILEGNNPNGKTIAFRSELDALPIFEKIQSNFTSQHPGIMHACGHDIHMACLLGIAKIMSKLRSHFNGKIMFIFQPSEEVLPGGAIQMIKEGIFNEIKPDYLISQHVAPEIETGKIGIKSGMMMASVDELFITIKGKGGHAAIPNKITDTIYIASQVIISLQQITSRLANPIIPTVLSFGKISAEGATNIIPDEVKIAGTFRTTDEKWRQDALQKITEITHSIAKTYGGDAEIIIQKGYPALFNNTELTEKIKKISSSFLGEKNILKLKKEMIAEDFSYFTEIIPSCMLRLGIKQNNKQPTNNLHSPSFNPDEKSILIGCGLMSWICYSLIQETISN